MVAIIDYDAGNIKSVEKALQFLGADTMITRNPQEILSADHVVLPGVGAYADAMEKLAIYGLIEVIHKVIACGTPFLGICLGLQVLFESSQEGGQVKGLGILKGHICKIPDNQGYKVPHIGWNSLEINSNSRLLAGLPLNPFVYFVHSYYLQASDEEIVSATTEYGTLIHAAVECQNIFACQFHPEKSSNIGLKVLENFLTMKKEEC
ncbi:MAG: imidazole glycerol phosphate synthase subunit HisH [Eubacteriales bacterium]